MSELHKKQAIIQRGMHVPKDKAAFQNRYRFKSANDILCQAKKVMQENGIDDVAIYVTDNEPVFKDCNHNLVDKIAILGILLDKSDSALKRVDNAMVKSLLEMPAHEVYCVATATISDGTDSISTTSWAKVDYQSESNKSLDPAQVNGKVSSYARKYALSGLLMVDDEQDSDVQAEQPVRNNQPKPAVVEKISKKDINNVLELLKVHGLQLDQLLTIAHIDRIEDMRVDKVATLKAWLISDKCKAKVQELSVEIDKTVIQQDAANDKIAQNERDAIAYNKRKSGGA